MISVLNENVEKKEIIKKLKVWKKTKTNFVKQIKTRFKNII